MMDRSESIRIHLDWWAKCRTCAFFMGDRETCHLADGMCSGVGSPFHGEIVTDDGYCPKWDSFDIDVALAIMSLDGKNTRWGLMEHEAVVELVNAEIDCMGSSG